jgi:membrane-associated phospholipid phosphatase
MTATRFQKIIALWLLAGVVAFAIAWQLDDAAGRALIVRNNPGLHSFAAFCSKLGEGWVVVVAGLVGAGTFLLLGSPQLAARIFFIAFTSSIAGLVATILRTLIGRTRPNNHMMEQGHVIEQGIYGVWHAGHWIITQPAFSALPSGHAATAAGVAAAAWLVNRTAGAIFAVYALAVMWSRIALECHHLSDVTASFFLAVILALILRKHFAAANDIFFRRLAQKL